MLNDSQDRSTHSVNEVYRLCSRVGFSPLRYCCHYRSVSRFSPLLRKHRSYPLSFCSLVAGNTSFQYRHWGCVTAKQFENMVSLPLSRILSFLTILILCSFLSRQQKKDFTDAADLDGFEDLTEEDQQRVKTAFENGHGESLVSWIQ